MKVTKNSKNLGNMNEILKNKTIEFEKIKAEYQDLIRNYESIKS